MATTWRLVGKGITFDSGGISIKPAAGHAPHEVRHVRCRGGARQRGAIARLGLQLNLIAVAPCTENLPGGHATKPGDVFTSMSGKTVEVINTDAEGRLVLIDGVTYVQRQGATAHRRRGHAHRRDRDRPGQALHRRLWTAATASSRRSGAPVS